jgi:hypothetical protein
MASRAVIGIQPRSFAHSIRDQHELVADDQLASSQGLHVCEAGRQRHLASVADLADDVRQADVGKVVDEVLDQLWPVPMLPAVTATCSSARQRLPAARCRAIPTLRPKGPPVGNLLWAA